MEILNHPDELVAMLKLKMALMSSGKKIPSEPHWRFCYSILNKVSRSFAFTIQRLHPKLRDSICVFYLFLRALDTIEDDTSISAEVKVPILIDFHELIYDRDWRFSCGTKDCKLLMDQFYHVSTAFFELETIYQEVIVDYIKREGAGMAKFICKKVESIGDYDEYCSVTAGYIGLGLSKLFHVSGLEDLAPEHLSDSVGLFLQKVNIIRDYLEDINEMPKPRMFWPPEIWSKYVNKLEDLKHEENSEKAVQCLNEMVTNALIHVEDCISYVSAMRDRIIFKSCAIPLIMAIGTLTLCYKNIQVFRGVVKMRRGLAAKVADNANTMADVYGATFDFSCMLKAKIDKNDPNATKTLSRIEDIQKICRDSGTLGKRKLYIQRSDTRFGLILVMIIFIILAVVVAWTGFTTTK
ncbi:hypothetical protein V2J09_018417 [Rumex salicifolius]